MSTIVFLHAHPDDEASQTSGTMRQLADAGHRVVCVYATNGDHGTVPVDLAPGETIVDRRRAEAQRSAEVVGTARVAWLGYADSGLTGWEQNRHETSFHAADTEEAARRLAVLLDEEGADVLVGYDWHGGYGHPDHVRVHHVTHRAAALAAQLPRVLEATMNRDQIRRLLEAAKAAGVEDADWDADGPADDGNPVGTPEAELHWRVDARPVLAAKRAALSSHASQEDVGWFLGMPEEQFAAVLGDEWFIEPGRAPGLADGLFALDRPGAEGLAMPLRYGAHPDQVVDVRIPEGPHRGVAVLVHGGYWRAPYTKELMDPMAEDLLARGWVTVNVEYRRVGAGGGWPETADDVRVAVQEVCRVRSSRGWPGPVVAVGHSAGGHLALLAADLVDAVVALAPVTDLASTRDLGLGDDAVRDFIPEHLVDLPATYREASPVERLPLGRPVLVVHGDLDDRVPQQQSRAYVARAREAGDQVELRDPSGVDHFQVIDPAHPSWRVAAGWIEALPA